MAGADDKPISFTRGDARKIIQAAGRVLSTAPPLPGGRRGDGGFGNGVLIGVLDEQLDHEGTAVATIWAFYPEEVDPETEVDPTAGELKASPEKMTVFDWMLNEGYHLESGARIVIAVTPTAALVIQSRECPVEDD